MAPTRPAGATAAIALVLEHEFETDDGIFRLIDDFIPVREREPDLVRIIEGVEGEVQVEVGVIKTGAIWRRAGGPERDRGVSR